MLGRSAPALQLVNAYYSYISAGICALWVVPSRRPFERFGKRKIIACGNRERGHGTKALGVWQGVFALQPAGHLDLPHFWH